MSDMVSCVVFSLEGQKYALYLSIVERILSVVEITPLPHAPEIVLGAINLQGEIIPVIDVRRRFGLPKKTVELSDRLIIARTAKRRLALLADSVIGVIGVSEKEMVAANNVLPHLELVAGIVKQADGLVLIHDLDTFLSLDEDKDIEAALNAEQNKDGY